MIDFDQTGRRAALALALATAIAAGSGTIALAQERVLTIGCSLPLTGRMVGFGEPVKAGMDLAIEEYNTTKRIPGVRFELLCNDSKGDPKETINIAQRLIDNQAVIASISDFTSTATMAAAETYQKGGLVQMTPTASHPDLTKMNPWMFRASLTVPVYIEPMADFLMKNVNARKIAVVQVQTDWGVSAGTAFVDRLKAIGGEVASLDAYNEGTTDFRAILTQIRRRNPDAIFLAMLEEEAVNFMKQRQQFAMTQPVMDSSVGITPRSLGLGGSAMEGMYTNILFNESSPLQEVKDFVARYRQKHGADKTPDQWNAYGYDAASMIMLAAGRAMPNPTRQAIRDQLAQTRNFRGANGELSVDPQTREVSRSSLTFPQVRNGVRVPLN